MDKDVLKFIIQRFDSYYNASNTKGSFFLGFSTFLCGAIVASYKSLLTLIEPGNTGVILFFNILTISIICLCSISILIVCIAIKPYLTSGNSSKEKYHSLIFFGSIAEYDEDEYAQKVKDYSDDELLEDMSKQACILAKGLSKKYNLLFWASWLIPVKILLIIILIIIVILK
jgi:hypothetical protein